MEKANNEQEGLSIKIDDLLRLQNDSHYTIGGVIREKLEDLEERNEIFREQLESRTTMVSESLQEKLAAITEKFSESERMISNMETEVNLLKIGVDLMKNTVTQRTSDLIAKTEISVGKERKIDDPTAAEETMKDAVKPPSLKEKKELTNEEKKIRELEAVLEKKLIGEYEWMKDRVSIVLKGVKFYNGHYEQVISLSQFLHRMKNRPDAIFSKEKYEVECRNCGKTTVLHPLLRAPNAVPCHNCQMTIVLGDPPENQKYLSNDCGHIDVVPMDLPSYFPCFICKKGAQIHSDNLVSQQMSYMRRIEITERELLERTLKYSHLEWIRKRITFVDDHTVRIDSGELMEIEMFDQLVLACPWSLFPEEFEVDCHSCGRILTLWHDDGAYIKNCPFCSKTTVVTAMRFNDKTYRMTKFACGHHAEVRSDWADKSCPACGNTQPVPCE